MNDQKPVIEPLVIHTRTPGEGHEVITYVEGKIAILFTRKDGSVETSAMIDLATLIALRNNMNDVIELLSPPSQQKFKVLVDGKEVALPTVNNDVKVIVEQVDEEGTQVHHNFTHEGVVMDVVDLEGSVLSSSSVTYNEL